MSCSRRRCSHAWPRSAILAPCVKYRLLAASYSSCVSCATMPTIARCAHMPQHACRTRRPSSSSSRIKTCRRPSTRSSRGKHPDGQISGPAQHVRTNVEQARHFQAGDYDVERLSAQLSRAREATEAVVASGAGPRAPGRGGSRPSRSPMSWATLSSRSSSSRCNSNWSCAWVGAALACDWRPSTQIRSRRRRRAGQSRRPRCA